MVLGISRFIVCCMALSKYFDNFFMNSFISSGSFSIWLYNLLNLFLAVFSVFDLKIKLIFFTNSSSTFNSDWYFFFNAFFSLNFFFNFFFLFESFCLCLSLFSILPFRPLYFSFISLIFSFNSFISLFNHFISYWVYCVCVWFCLSSFS